MMRFIIIFLFMVCLSRSITAQDSARLSLDQVLTQIENNYPAILKYAHNIKAWEEQAEGAGAWMPPTFGAGLMRWPYNLGMMREQNNPMNQAGLAFSLEQMIPNATKLNSKREYITSLAEIEKARSEWTKNELRREARILYYQRYVSDKKLEVVSESQDLLRLLLQTAETKFSNNRSELQTIYKAKARLSETANMILMLQSQADESTVGLNTLMTRPAGTSFKIDTLIEPRRPESLTVPQNISDRSDIAAMTKNIRTMELEQRVMKTGTRPDFGVRAEHMKMFGMPDQWSLMGMITIPIVPWASKMYTSETKAMDFRIRAMEEEKQTMELMAGRMLAEKMLMLISETRQYDNYHREILPAFDDNLQANLLAYRNDTGDFFVLLDAWEMLLMKKIEMYDKLFNVLKLEAEYDYELETR